MAEILVVDDDPGIIKLLEGFLSHHGHTVAAANNLSAGLAAAQKGSFAAILLDVYMPDGNGLDFLPQFRAVSSHPEILIMTGQGDQDGAEKAIKSGAWGYVEKTQLTRDLNLHLTRALEYRMEKGRSNPQPVSLKREHIIGNSPAISRCLDQLALAASGDVGVLLTGETGTGKEVFARAIHDNSKRAAGNFIVVDCASLPENLIESTLFGHSKGAFTGAGQAMDGLVKLADSGILFLDEVGELPLHLQKSFLRVLQEKHFRPVGGRQEIHSDFRLVAATNRNLAEMVEAGTFRADLLFRIQAFTIHLPPLRERTVDLKLLAGHFMGSLCERNNLECKGFSSDFLATLTAYDWPGNVRELFQTLEQAFTVALHSPTLFATHLPEKLRIHQARSSITAQPQQPAQTPENLVNQGPPPPLQEAKDRFEREYLHQVLALSQGNVSAASQMAGLSRTHFYRLLAKHKMQG
ncbi:MAG: sigma-54 dependent transcriptional regulator [Thermodesulfobacteriota bacterium]